MKTAGWLRTELRAREDCSQALKPNQEIFVQWILELPWTNGPLVPSVSCLLWARMSIAVILCLSHHCMWSLLGGCLFSFTGPQRRVIAPGVVLNWLHPGDSSMPGTDFDEILDIELMEWDSWEPWRTVNRFCLWTGHESFGIRGWPLLDRILTEASRFQLPVYTTA